MKAKHKTTEGELLQNGIMGDNTDDLQMILMSNPDHFKSPVEMKESENYQYC